ncbi:hypothetical protein DSL72_005214 [Monilinia vaccinii-corymbosi]|uniref:Linalool dehydratase/isomerase domain-containing protein n=1 Tax=Monilinia vaccinii-corymbosi TaxID=61207 RepID=A0A8A3PF30_9HELO|nr:hypothetical protein DSL72_005214 [Monilinia vaccinii-corymbosi]
MSFFNVATALLAASATARAGAYVTSLPCNAQGLFNESMDYLDRAYDKSAGYLYDTSGSTALRHETRNSAWYAIGLLARNQGSDVLEAEKIISNVIDAQFKVPEDQWYGDYQVEPEEPELGSPHYAPKMYNSWDPNWRGFIGTAFIVGLEEFGFLISPEVTSLMLESLHNATVGDGYRVGGVDGDNLYPAYTNPSLMRAFVSGWTGRRLNDSNMTTSGENYAQQIIDLFDRANTLSEFNSGTYTGVSLFAMTLWAKYLPEDSVMKQRGASMIQYTWEAVSNLWHPQLLNVAGPWDRAYGFDMTKYLSLLALHIWNAIGKEKSSIIDKPYLMSHNSDFAYGPLFAILSEFHNSLIPDDVKQALGSFKGEHTFASSTYSPPFDLYPRNITAWLANNMSIGAETFNENIIGGPAKNQRTFNPALMQWNNGNGIGWLTLYATEKHVIAKAAPGSLNLTYPDGNETSIITLLISPFAAKKTLSSLADIQGLNLTVSGTIDSNYTLSYAGDYGGTDATINDFEYWNVTFAMPAGSTEAPHICLEVDLW